MTVWAITTGRSGSRWLAETLDKISGVCAVHEPEPRLFAVNRAAAEGSDVLAELGRLRPLEGVDVEISPFMAHLVPSLVRLFPGVRFIHLHRDPRAFVASALSTWFPVEPRQSDWWPELPFREPWQDMVWWWAEVHRRGLAAERVLGSRVCRVSAEGLWRGDELKSLVVWLGGSAVPTPAKKVNAGLGHEAWSPSWESFLQEVAGDVMQGLGRH